MKKLALILAIPLLLIGLSGCGETQNNPEDTVDSAQLLENASKQVLAALKIENMAYISQLVHPQKGVRFSPYGYIDTENDVVLTADEVKNIKADSRSFVWGRYDGTGEPIDESFSAYYNEFIYDRDFANAEEVGKNEIIGTGNSLINIKTVYPDAEFYEYHFPGFNPEYGGMDWVSLRLVFEEYNGEWYLVGIIHDQWTI